MADNITTPNTATSTPNADISPLSQKDFYTLDNVHQSVGQQLQQTLFWDFARNVPPTALQRMPTLSATYPSLVSGGLIRNPDNTYRAKSWEEIGQESMRELKQANPY